MHYIHMLAAVTSVIVAHASASQQAHNAASSPIPRQSFVSAYRAQAVKEVFQFAWDGHIAKCFRQDELNPHTGTCGHSRNGWGAGAIDALSTAILMENAAVVHKILRLVPEIDFSRSHGDPQVELFETTIRYLGGMLSAYDLLTGPFEHLADNQTQVDALLKQSIFLADRLSFAFDTPSGIPHNILYFDTNTTDGENTNGLATTGSLILEWTHLTAITGNVTYRNLADMAEYWLMYPEPVEMFPFSGLVGNTIDISTRQFTNSRASWTGGSDSFYEYLLKMYVYDSEKYPIYGAKWIQAAYSTTRHLASHPSSRPELTFLAITDGTQFDYVSDHLACFAGGNFILGGLVLGNKRLLDFGLDLVHGCEALYNSTATGIGPDSYT